MEQTNPTRTELLAKRTRIRLVRQGADLLRNKREALMREFLKELPRYAAVRETLKSALFEASRSLMRSLSVDGPEALASSGLASRKSIEIEVTERTIRGVRIADVESEYRSLPAGGHRYTAIGTSARIEDATERFEKVLERIIETAPLEKKMMRLADEIRKTTRRVNALEQRLLPSLEEQVKYIRGVLDQREREDVFRLKRLKKVRTGE